MIRLGMTLGVREDRILVVVSLKELFTAASIGINAFFGSFV